MRRRRCGRIANNALLSGLHDDLKDEIIDACRLVLDGLAIWSESSGSNVVWADISVRRNRPDATCLAGFTC